MTKIWCGRTAAALAGALAALTSNASMAASYTFSQGGYAEGASVSGSFQGVDLDSDGMLISFLGEITGFSLAFSGNSVIAPFTHQFTDLYGLAYHVANSTLGGVDSGIVPEGIASNFLGVAGHEFLTGVGPTGGSGGRITDIASGLTTATAQLVQVTVVPEPGTYALMLCGLGAVGWRLRRRRTAVDSTTRRAP